MVLKSFWKMIVWPASVHRVRFSELNARSPSGRCKPTPRGILDMNPRHGGPKKVSRPHWTCYAWHNIENTISWAQSTADTGRARTHKRLLDSLSEFRDLETDLKRLSATLERLTGFERFLLHGIWETSTGFARGGGQEWVCSRLLFPGVCPSRPHLNRQCLWTSDTMHPQRYCCKIALWAFGPEQPN